MESCMHFSELNHGIQHLDTLGRVLSDLARPSSNPFHQTVAKYAEMIFSSIQSGPLRTLFWYFDGADQYEADITDEVRATALEMGLQTAWHFAYLDSEPFSLVVLADVTRPIVERLQRANKFKRKLKCCREDGMEDKVWNHFPTGQAMLDDWEFLQLMSNWDERHKLCSMQVERLLALIKKSVEEGRPPAERICASGFLNQWLSEHLSAGGDDPRINSEKAAISVGAPLNRAATATADSLPEKGRGFLKYMHEQYALKKREHGPFSKQEARELQAALCNEFWSLPLAKQQEYNFRAKNEMSVT